MNHEELNFGRDADEVAMAMNREPLSKRVLDAFRRLIAKSKVKNPASFREEDPRSQEPIES